MVASQGPQLRKRTLRGWSIEQAAKFLSVLAEALVLKSEIARAHFAGEFSELDGRWWLRSVLALARPSGTQWLVQ